MSNWNVPSGDNKINLKKALRKKKLIKILNICSYCLSFLFIGCFIIALCVSCNGHKVDEDGNVVERFEPKRMIINDSDSYISFYESDIVDVSLFEYVYSYLNIHSSVDVDNSSLVVLLNGEYSETSRFDTITIGSYNDALCISFSSDLKWVYDSVEENIWIQDSDLEYYFGTIPFEVPSYSEAEILSFDIFCESSSQFLSYMSSYGESSDLPIDESIFSALTSSVSNFIFTLSSGIGSVLALFWANNQLTVLGTLVVLVVSVALAYFVFRLIIGLIRLRG